MPRVSVIIPTYNCASYIERAIESALAQTYRDFEIIVADDGSNDETRTIVARHAWPIIYEYQPNGGLSSARNLAISKASGEFLAYLDADDTWLPQRLARQVDFLDSHPECSFVHSDVSIIDEQDRVLHTRFNRETERPRLEGHCLLGLLATSCIHVPSVLERKAAFDRTAPFDTRIRAAEDYLHWIHLLVAGGAAGYIDEPLARYRWRQGSLTREPLKMGLAMAAVYDILRREVLPAGNSGLEARALIGRHMAALHTSLSHDLRHLGEHSKARRHSRRALRESPTSRLAYLELLKSFIPAGLLNRGRKARVCPTPESTL